jgi:hypothetical protein
MKQEAQAKRKQEAAEAEAEAKKAEAEAEAKKAEAEAKATAAAEAEAEAKKAQKEAAEAATAQKEAEAKKAQKEAAEAATAQKEAAEAATATLSNAKAIINKLTINQLNQYPITVQDKQNLANDLAKSINSVYKYDDKTLTELKERLNVLFSKAWKIQFDK